MTTLVYKLLPSGHPSYFGSRLSICCGKYDERYDTRYKHKYNRSLDVPQFYRTTQLLPNTYQPLYPCSTVLNFLLDYPKTCSLEQDHGCHTTCQFSHEDRQSDCANLFFFYKSFTANFLCTTINLFLL